jgi:hypothetical protein
MLGNMLQLWRGFAVRRSIPVINRRQCIFKSNSLPSLLVFRQDVYEDDGKLTEMLQINERSQGALAGGDLHPLERATGLIQYSLKL